MTKWNNTDSKEIAYNLLQWTTSSEAAHKSMFGVIGLTGHAVVTHEERPGETMLGMRMARYAGTTTTPTRVITMDT